MLRSTLLVISVPFIFTPFIIDPLHKSLANPRYRNLSLAVTAIIVITFLFLIYLVIMSLT